MSTNKFIDKLNPEDLKHEAEEIKENIREIDENIQKSIEQKKESIEQKKESIEDAIQKGQNSIKEMVENKPIDLFIYGSGTYSAYLFFKEIERSEVDFFKSKIVAMNDEDMLESKEIKFLKDFKKVALKNCLKEMQRSKLIVNFCGKDEEINKSENIGSEKDLIDFCLKHNINYIGIGLDPFLNLKLKEMTPKNNKIILSTNFTGGFYEILSKFLSEKNDKEIFSITDFQNCKMSYETYKSYINIFKNNRNIKKEDHIKLIKQIGGKNESVIKFDKNFHISLMGISNQMSNHRMNKTKNGVKNFFKVGGFLNVIIFYLLFFPIMYLSKFKFFENLFLQFYRFFSFNSVSLNERDYEKLEKQRIKIHFYELESHKEVMKVEAPNPLVLSQILLIEIIKRCLENEEHEEEKGGVFYPSEIFDKKIYVLIEKLMKKNIQIEKI